MAERVVVETRCPQCGAPLDFSESSNAVRCGHCRTALLVTGRKQLLSFWIRPRVERDAAVASAVPGSVEAGAGARLVFLPYYRFTAHDLIWKSKAPPKEKPIHGSFVMFSTAENDEASRLDLEPPDQVAAAVAVFGGIFKTIDWVIDRIEDAASAVVGKDIAPAPAKPVPPVRIGATPPASRRKPVLEWSDANLDGRRIERNFLALAISRPALFSIGVRASVLRLELFHRETIESFGWIAPVSLPPQEAIDRAIGSGGPDQLYRTTVAQALSLIWFPYWCIGPGRGGPIAIVDAVSGSVVDRNVPAALLADVFREMGLDPKTIGFRPLSCPNCGWDLPLHEDDTVFFCDSCGRAWQLQQSELKAVETEFADGAKLLRVGEEPLYLPFWIVAGRDGDEETRYFVPAFAYRGLEPVHRLAAMLSARQPEWEPAPVVPEGEKVGCLYDRSDGIRIAQFFHARSQMREGAKPEEITGLAVTRATLTWLPFARRGAMLFDPFFEANLYTNLVG